MNEDLPKYQPIGMKSKLIELEEKLAELEGTNSAPKRSFIDVMTGKRKSEKEFTLPRKVRSKKKIEKQNYGVTVILKSNGGADIVLCPIVDDMMYVKQFDNYYVVTSNSVYRYNKYPLVVIPEWNVEAVGQKPKAFNPEDDLERIANGDGKLAYAEKVLVNRLSKVDAEMKEKKTFPMNWLWIVIGIGIVLYFVAKMLGKA